MSFRPTNSRVSYLRKVVKPGYPMSNLAVPSEQDSVPEITLRIPGPWESPEQLREALAEADAGCIMAAPEPGSEMCVIHQPSGQRFRVSAVERDDEIVELFKDSGRMRSGELKALKTHKVKMFVSGPGGSPEAARTFLAVGAAFIKAGALGVMVDNSGICHSPRDWPRAGRRQGHGGHVLGVRLGHGE